MGARIRQAEGDKPELRTAAAAAIGHSQEHRTGAEAVQAGEAEAIKLATEVYRPVGVVAPRAEGAHLAGLQAVGAKAARKRAARAAPPVWAALVAVAPAAGAADGGGNHS